MRELKGATMWARKTLESDIFFNKPDKWFKIWFCIVQLANFKPNGQFERGEFLTNGLELQQFTGATEDQVKKALRYFRNESMISTKRSTRGVRIKVLNFAKYQDLKNYRSTGNGTSKALEKHFRSTTIVKNENNDKNVNNNDLGFSLNEYS